MYKINEELYKKLKNELVLINSRYPNVKKTIIDNLLMRISVLKNCHDCYELKASVEFLKGSWHSCWISKIFPYEYYLSVSTLIDGIYNDLTAQIFENNEADKVIAEYYKNLEKDFEYLKSHYKKLCDAIFASIAYNKTGEPIPAVENEAQFKEVLTLASEFFA